MEPNANVAYNNVPDKESDFQQIDTGNEGGVPQVAFSGSNMNRERPASMVSRTTVGSTPSRTARAANIKQSKETIRNFFSYRTGVFENAVETCQQKAIKPNMDGSLLGAWLLTEIDHWDCEKEKVVLLTENSLLICKFDFIALKLYDVKRLMLHNAKVIAIGNLVYPEKSVMPPRTQGGVRVIFGREEDLGTLEKWNPFTSQVPFFTFAHHPILYCKEEEETVTYNVDDFYEALLQQTKAVYRVKKPGENVQEFQGNILIESYASLTSMVFNQSMLGYSKERGGISF